MLSPGLGRFDRADTVADGFNRFQYVRGNPIVNVDPSGHSCTCSVAPPGKPPQLAVGDLAHIAIELDFVLKVAPGQSIGTDIGGSFDIPGAGRGGGDGRPDIVYFKSVAEKQLYEIKPESQFQLGYEQEIDYIYFCNLAGLGPCTEGNYYPSNIGDPYVRRIFHAYGVTLESGLAFGAGVLLYRFKGDVQDLMDAAAAWAAARLLYEFIKRLVEQGGLEQPDGEKIPQPAFCAAPQSNGNLPNPPIRPISPWMT